MAPEILKRFNNIAVAELGPERQIDTLAIIRYHKNQYYGMLEEYLSSGWSDTPDSIHWRGVSLEKRLFSSPEDNYTLAFVELHPDGGTTHLRSVEDRILGLPPCEHPDFFEAYQYADLAILHRTVASGESSP